MLEYTKLNATQLAKLIRLGEIDAISVLNLAISEIEKTNPFLNAVIQKMYDQAKQELTLLDKNSKFFGVPLLIKDLLIDYKGIPTSQGSCFFNSFSATENSVLVQNYRDLGFIILGKTNTPEFGLNCTTEPKAYGPTRNPWNLALSAGGSSGGSASAVSARMVPIAHASDAGGSIRYPASCCGVFGLKPTRGYIKSNDIFPALRWIATDHVITRSVYDSASVFTSMAIKKESAPNLDFLDKNKPPTFVINAIEEPFFCDLVPISDENKSSFKKAINALEDMGHSVIFKKISLPPTQQIIEAYLTIIAGSLVSVIDTLTKHSGRKLSKFSFETQTYIMYKLGRSFTAASFSKALDLCALLEKNINILFQDANILLTPSLVTPPPTIGSLSLSSIENFFLDLFRFLPVKNLSTSIMDSIAKDVFSLISFFPIFNMSGHPAVTMPIIYENGKLPYSIQMIAPHYHEHILFSLSKQIENYYSFDVNWPCPPLVE